MVGVEQEEKLAEPHKVACQFCKPVGDKNVISEENVRAKLCSCVGPAKKGTYLADFGSLSETHARTSHIFPISQSHRHKGLDPRRDLKEKSWASRA